MSSGPVSKDRAGDEVRPLPRVLFFGDPLVASADYRQVLVSLEQSVPPDCLAVVHSRQRLCQSLETEGWPDLLIVLQTWTDEIHVAGLLELPGCGPVCRMLIVYGAWCVSDGRSRPDFPLALRVPLDEFPAIFQDEWNAITTAVKSPVPTASSLAHWLPWTAGRDEIFRQRYGEPLRGALATDKSRAMTRDLPREWPALHAPVLHASTLSFSVRSADRQLAVCWGELLQQAGYHPSESPEVCLWDWDTPPCAMDLRESELRVACHTLQVVLLTGWATPELMGCWNEGGVARIVSKMAPLNHLLRAVEEVLQAGRVRG